MATVAGVPTFETGRIQRTTPGLAVAFPVRCARNVAADVRQRVDKRTNRPP